DIADFVDEFEDGEGGLRGPVCRDAEWDCGRQAGIEPRLGAEGAGVPGPAPSSWFGHGFPPRRCFAFRSARSLASLARYDSPSIDTISALGSRRTSIETRQPALGKSARHSVKARLVVMVVRFCSQRRLISSNNRS